MKTTHEVEKKIKNDAEQIQMGGELYYDPVVFVGDAEELNESTSSHRLMSPISDSDIEEPDLFQPSITRSVATSVSITDPLTNILSKGFLHLTSSKDKKSVEKIIPINTITNDIIHLSKRLDKVTKECSGLINAEAQDNFIFFTNLCKIVDAKSSITENGEISLCSKEKGTPIGIHTLVSSIYLAHLTNRSGIISNIPEFYKFWKDFTKKPGDFNFLERWSRYFSGEEDESRAALEYFEKYGAIFLWGKGEQRKGLALLEGWNKGDYLFLHAWSLISLIVRIKKGFVNVGKELIDKKDISKDKSYELAVTAATEDAIYKLLYELAVTTEALRNYFEVFACKNNEDKLDDLSKVICLKISDLEVGQEYVMASGAQGNDGGHAAYAVFMRTDKDKITIRVDNRGEGIYQGYRINDQYDFHHKIENKTSSLYKVAPSFIKTVSIEHFKNCEEEILKYIKGVCKSVKQQDKPLLSILAEGLYNEGVLSNLKKLNRDITIPARKIQTRAGNCVVYSWKVGEFVRLGGLTNRTLYKLAQREERNFAAGFYKIWDKVIIQERRQKSQLGLQMIQQEKKEELVEEKALNVLSNSGQAGLIEELRKDLSNERQEHEPLLTMFRQKKEIKLLQEQEIKIKQEMIQAFLNYVIAGQQDEAEALLKKSPILALGAGNVTDHANRTFYNITGFQYSVWALDWHMWRMIKKYLPQEEASLQAEGFTTGSWVKEHGEHAGWTIKKVTDAQKTLENNWGKWDSKKCNTHWVQQVGGAQLILPMHVLQEYCQPDRPFEPCPKFSDTYTLVRALPEWLWKGKRPGQDLGVKWAIFRSHADHAIGDPTCDGFLANMLISLVPDDRFTLDTLSSTRLQQRGELVAELRPSVKLKKKELVEEKALKDYKEEIQELGKFFNKKERTSKDYMDRIQGLEKIINKFEEKATVKKEELVEKKALNVSSNKSWRFRDYCSIL